MTLFIKYCSIPVMANLAETARQVDVYAKVHPDSYTGLAAKLPRPIRSLLSWMSEDIIASYGNGGLGSMSLSQAQEIATSHTRKSYISNSGRRMISRAKIVR